MAGGIFTAQDKVRPGVYVNTEGMPERNDNGSKGTLLLADDVARNWGKHGVITLTPDSDFKQLIGTDLSDDSTKAINAAFSGGVARILYVNSNNGQRAVVNDEKLPWTFTAAYAGSKGNDLTIDVIKNMDGSSVTVKYIFGTELIATERVSSAEQLMGNNFVTVQLVKGADDIFAKLVGENSYKMTGGTTAADNDLSDALSDALERCTFDVATTAGIDLNSNMHALLAQLVQDMRDKNGYHVTAVVPGLPTTKYDSDAVSVVVNGVVLNDGTVIDTTNAAAFFAGASASCPLSESLTNTEYPGTKDTLPRLNNENIIDALNAGHVVFTNRRNGSVVIEQDINSLVTINGKKNGSFRKNRTIRTLDYISNHIKEIAEKTFIGKISNNETGRGLLKAEIVKALRDMQDANEIEDFQPADVTTVAGDASDAVTVNIMVKPVDSIEKIYMTIKAQ